MEVPTPHCILHLQRFLQSLSVRFSSDPLGVFKSGVGSFWRKKQISYCICIPVTLTKRRRLDMDGLYRAWVEVGYSTNLWPNCPFNCNTGSNWKSGLIKSLCVETIQVYFYRSPIWWHLQQVHLVGGSSEFWCWIQFALCLALAFGIFSGMSYLLESCPLYCLNRLFSRPYTIMNRLLFAYQHPHYARGTFCEQ